MLPQFLSTFLGNLLSKCKSQGRNYCVFSAMERKQSQERKNILKRLKERKKKDKEASRKKRKLDDSDEREDEPDVIEDKKQEESKEAKEEEDAAPPSPRTPAIKPGPKKKKKAPSKARNNKTGLILKMHKAVREAEARASQGQPLPSLDSLPTEPIYYRWSRYDVLLYRLNRSSPSQFREGKLHRTPVGMAIQHESLSNYTGWRHLPNS